MFFYEKQLFNKCFYSSVYVNLFFGYHLERVKRLKHKFICILYSIQLIDRVINERRIEKG